MLSLLNKKGTIIIEVQYLMNTLKDLTYITDLLNGMDNAEKLSDLSKSFYKKAVDDGDGELFISELIKKN